MSEHIPSTRIDRLAHSQLWGGPRAGAELDGLTRRFEIPPHVP